MLDHHSSLWRRRRGQGSCAMRMKVIMLYAILFSSIFVRTVQCVCCTTHSARVLRVIYRFVVSLCVVRSLYPVSVHGSSCVNNLWLPFTLSPLLLLFLLVSFYPPSHSLSSACSSFSHKVRAAGGVKVIVSIMDLYEDDAGVLAVGSDALSGLCSKVRYDSLIG